MNVSSDALTNTFPDAVSAQQQLLTSSVCAWIFTVRLSAMRSYTDRQGVSDSDILGETTRTEDHAAASRDDLIAIGRKLATPDAEVIIVIPHLVPC